MVRPVHNVLFVCERNSSQSILAESILNGLGGGRFRGHSAGWEPAGHVDAEALLALAGQGYPTAGLRSKSVDEFLRPGAPALDFVITLSSDGLPRRAHVLPRSLAVAHWEVEDPAARPASPAERRAAIDALLATLRRRVQHVTGLPFESVDARALGVRLREIGALP